MIARKNLTCKIISLRGKIAQIEVLGKVLEVERDNVPTNAKEGEELVLNLQDPKEAEINRKEIAQHILEEILNGK